MNSSRCLEKILIFFILSLFLIVFSYAIVFGLWREKTPFENYFQIIFFIAVYYLVHSRVSNGLNTSDRTNSDRNIAIGLFLCSLVTKPFLTYLIPMDNDEISQQFITNFNSPFMAAALQQQPPLGYYFSFWTNQLFGLTEFAIRSHACVFGSLFISCYFLLLRSLSFSISSSLLSVLFIFLNPIIFQFGFSGRSVSLALVIELFLLFEISNLFNKGTNGNRELLRIALLALLLLFSIGFQSLVFVGALNVVSLIIAINNRNWLFLRCSVFLLICLILFAPIQNDILGYSQRFIKSFDWRTINFSDLPRIIYPAQKFLLQIIYTLVSLGVILFGLKIFAKQKKTLAIKETEQTVQFFSMLFFVFMVSAIIIFLTMIQFALNSRYLILAVPLFGIIVTYLVDSIGQLLGQKFIFFKPKINIFFKGILYFACYGLFFLPIAENFYFSSTRFPREALNYAKDRLDEPDIYLPLCPYQSGFCWDHLYLKEFLLAENTPGMTKKLSDPYFYLLEKTIRREPTGSIILSIRTRYSQEKIVQEFADLNPIFIGHLPVFHLQKNNNWLDVRRILTFFKSEARLDQPGCERQFYEGLDILTRANLQNRAISREFVNFNCFRPNYENYNEARLKAFVPFNLAR